MYMKEKIRDERITIIDKVLKNVLMLGNGLLMMLESELLSIELIINFLDNGEDQLLVIIFWTNYKS